MAGENRLRIVISAEGKDAEEKLGRIRRGLDITAQEAERGSRRSERAFRAQKAAISETAVQLQRLYRQVYALATLYAGSQFARHVIDTANAFERYRLTIQTFEKDADRAARKWRELLLFARDTPYTIREVMNSYVTLRAYGLNPTIDVMRALGDTAAVVGKDRLPLIALALGQIRTNSKVMMQDLNQLTQSGIAVNDALVEAFGVGRNELDKINAAIEQGVISTQDVIDAFIRYMQKQFGGQMERQMQTLSGQWDVLKSQVEMFEDRLMQAGAYNTLTGVLRRINDELGRMSDADVARWGKALDDAFKTGFDWLVTHQGDIKDVLGFVEANLKGIGAAAGDMFDLAEAVGEMATAISRMDDSIPDKIFQAGWEGVLVRYLTGSTKMGVVFATLTLAKEIAGLEWGEIFGLTKGSRQWLGEMADGAKELYADLRELDDWLTGEANRAWDSFTGRTAEAKEGLQGVGEATRHYITITPQFYRGLTETGDVLADVTANAEGLCEQMNELDELFNSLEFGGEVARKGPDLSGVNAGAKEAERALKTVQQVAKALDAMEIDLIDDPMLREIEEARLRFDSLRDTIYGVAFEANMDLDTFEKTFGTTLDRIDEVEDRTIRHIIDQHKDASNTVTEVWQNAISAIDDALQRWVDTGKMELGDFANVWKRMIRQMVLDWALGQQNLKWLKSGGTEGAFNPGAMFGGIGQPVGPTPSGWTAPGWSTAAIISNFPKAISWGTTTQEWLGMSLAMSDSDFLGKVGLKLLDMPGWQFAMMSGIATGLLEGLTNGDWEKAAFEAGGAIIGSMVPIPGGTLIGSIIGGMVSSFFGDDSPDHSWFDLFTNRNLNSWMAQSTSPFGAIQIGPKGYYNDIGFDGRESQRKFAQHVTDLVAQLDTQIALAMDDALEATFARGIPEQVHAPSWRTDKKEQAERSVVEMLKRRYQPAFAAIDEALARPFEDVSTQENLQRVLELETNIVNTASHIPDFFAKFHAELEKGHTEAQALEQIQGIDQFIRNLLVSPLQNAIMAGLKDPALSSDVLKASLESELKTGFAREFVTQFVNTAIEDMERTAWDAFKDLPLLAQQYASGVITKEELMQRLAPIQEALDSVDFDQIIELLKQLGFVIDDTGSAAEDASDSFSQLKEALKSFEDFLGQREYGEFDWLSRKYGIEPDMARSWLDAQTTETLMEFAETLSDPELVNALQRLIELRDEEIEQLEALQQKMMDFVWGIARTVSDYLGVDETAFAYFEIGTRAGLSASEIANLPALVDQMVINPMREAIRQGSLNPLVSGWAWMADLSEEQMSMTQQLVNVRINELQAMNELKDEINDILYKEGKNEYRREYMDIMAWFQEEKTLAQKAGLFDDLLEAERARIERLNERFIAPFKNELQKAIDGGDEYILQLKELSSWYDEAREKAEDYHVSLILVDRALDAKIKQIKNSIMAPLDAIYEDIEGMRWQMSGRPMSDYWRQKYGSATTVDGQVSALTNMYRAMMYEAIEAREEEKTLFEELSGTIGDFLDSLDSVETSWQGLIEQVEEWDSALLRNKDTMREAANQAMELYHALDAQREKFSDLTSSALEAINEIRRTDPILLPQERFDIVMSQYSALMNQAMRGDVEAGQKAISMASDVLSAARDVWKSSEQYRAIEESILSDLEMLSRYASSQEDQIVDLLSQIRDALGGARGSYLEQLARNSYDSFTGLNDVLNDIAHEISRFSGAVDTFLDNLGAAPIHFVPHASGGILTKPTAFPLDIGIAGEAGPEAIIPLGHGYSLSAKFDESSLKRAVRDAMIEAMTETNSDWDRPLHITVEVGGDEFDARIEQVADNVRVKAERRGLGTRTAVW